MLDFLSLFFSLCRVQFRAGHLDLASGGGRHGAGGAIGQWWSVHYVSRDDYILPRLTDRDEE